MPILKSALKKMRKDKVRTLRNKKRENNLKSLVKKMRRESSPAIFSQVTSALDKAVKVNLIHPNKAARLKSRLSKLMSEGAAKSASAKASPAKASVKTKKTSSKKS